VNRVVLNHNLLSRLTLHQEEKVSLRRREGPVKLNLKRGTVPLRYLHRDL
jgi:hypothetical protein